MKINVIKNWPIYILPMFFMAFFNSCEEKKLQSSDYKIDLFEKERQEGKAYVMSEQECLDASGLTLSTSAIKLVDSSSGRGRPIFIYKINSGKVLKTTRDSVVNFPFQFLSNQKIKLKKEPMYVYLQKLQGYRFIAEEKKLKYQWLKDAPVYSVKSDQ